MNVLAISGSPSRDGNTSILIDEILKGAAEKGHTVNKIFLYDLEMKYCLACEDAAKTHAEKYCIHNDGFTTKLLPAILEADLLIIGSPVYMGQITGITKTMLDRWYTFITKDFSIRFLTDKKFITIVSSAADEDVFHNVTEYLDYWLSKFFKMEQVAQLHAGDLNGSGLVKDREELLRKAYEIGKNIIQQVIK